MGEEPTFQVWDGEKKGGEPKFFQNHRGGTKANHTMKKLSDMKN